MIRSYKVKKTGIGKCFNDLAFFAF